MSGERRPKPLLSVNAAADLWGRSRSATYQSARRGELPGLVRLNGRYYVRRAMFEAWLAGVGEAPSSLASDELTDLRDNRADGGSKTLERA